MTIRATKQVDRPLGSTFAVEGCDGDAKTSGDGDQFIVGNNNYAVLDAGNGGLIKLHTAFSETPGQIHLRHWWIVTETGFANSRPGYVLV
jgi:hypothetical protein